MIARDTPGSGVLTRFGLKLMCELRSAPELVAQARAAEAAGFEFVSISDHFHPWLGEHRHSPFAWSVLGGIATVCPQLALATGVTCPIGRYHPAIVAQAAATVATMSSAPFTLSVGAGERLNEHITGNDFPDVGRRHEMLAEAAGIIRDLWRGEWTTHRGRFFDAVDARIYEVPETPPRLVVAVSGAESLDVARTVNADGIVATSPERELVSGWEERGGDRAATWTEVAFAWAPDDDTGLRLAYERFRFSVAGWKVMSELPNPINFDAACATVRPEDVGQLVPYGPDPQRFIDGVRQFVDAGFENIAIIPVGDDLDGLLRFWSDEVAPALQPQGAAAR